LPVNVKTEKVDATFDKGALKVTFPKTEKAQRKEIQIKVSE
jgi:HSP20 family molecular chaperone IbpA